MLNILTLGKPMFISHPQIAGLSLASKSCETVPQQRVWTLGSDCLDPDWTAWLRIFASLSFSFVISKIGVVLIVLRF